VPLPDDPLRLVGAAAAVLSYLLLCARCLALGRRRADPGASAAMRSLGDGEPAVLLAYASQTGTAKAIALEGASAFKAAGVPARVVQLSDVSADTLSTSARALFVVSTYGEGDPPDNAAVFADRLLGQALSLAGLRYGVLALGDRDFGHFCGFGRALDGWLRGQGAQPLFPRIDLDKGDEAALGNWQRQIARCARGSSPPALDASETADALDRPDAVEPTQASAFHAWRLCDRRLLNPGSVGGPVFHLELEPAPGTPEALWEAGDLLRVRLPGVSARPRDYSIGSLHADARLELLVRQERHGDGSLGLASGWLTRDAALGSLFEARILPNPEFRLGENARRPLILIGNGTGLAGLRALLKAREAAGRRDNWLLFGERHAAHDFHHRADIERWQRLGFLVRCDLVFSRDQPERRYVQHRLLEARAELLDWVSRGAAIYVCGSSQGMASGVEAELGATLGRDGLDALIAQGRYRRDVY
jgi:sulfite reductase (NADPH) flavoprotein alpha-component